MLDRIKHMFPHEWRQHVKRRLFQQEDMFSRLSIYDGLAFGQAALSTWEHSRDLGLASAKRFGETCRA